MCQKTKLIVILCYIFLCLGCDNRSAGEVYKEDFLIPSFEGIVDSTELWKGGLLVVHLKDEKSDIQIINDHKILNQIKKGDFIKKQANSNKCYLKRRDSIFYFDCVNLERLNSDTKEDLGGVNQWDRNKINHWKY